MLEIPKRGSLVTQVVEILEKAIAGDEWDEILPGERQLCVRLQVGRSTLREALTVLQRKGLIQIIPGRASRITKPKPITLAPSLPVVGVLLSEQFEHMQNSETLMIIQLQRHLQDAGLKLHYHYDARLRRPHPHKLLEHLTQNTRVAGWVLCASTLAEQQWFAEKAVPTLLIGSPHTGIRLPSIDVDYKATCANAVKKCLRRGHRHIAMLTPESSKAGDLLGELGFQQAFEVGAPAEGSCRIIRHDGTAAAIRSSIDAIFCSAIPPTALLVSRPRAVLTVAAHLLRKGIRIPQDVALVSRDFDSVMSDFMPSIAGYRVDRVAFAGRVARLVVRLARGEVLPATTAWFTSEFITGESLGEYRPGV